MNQTLLIIVLFVWLVIASAVVIWIIVYFIRLSRGVDKGNLLKIIENLIRKEDDNQKSIRGIEKIIKDIQKENVYHIQKVGIVRFNPFRELGGDHSFSLALMDANLNGFVITGLHTRERTRIYIKNIERGKSKFELSNEEKEAVKKAERSEN